MVFGRPSREPRSTTAGRDHAGASRRHEPMPAHPTPIAPDIHPPVDEAGDRASHYFAPVETPSTRSSQAAPDDTSTSAPPDSCYRRPSVRLIRRASNGSFPSPLVAPSTPIVPGGRPVEPHDVRSAKAGTPSRPRSVSEPDRAQTPSLGMAMGATPRAPPKVRDEPAMPRLTEEGSRPSPSDLNHAYMPRWERSPNLRDHTDGQLQRGRLAPQGRSRGGFRMPNGIVRRRQGLDTAVHATRQNGEYNDDLIDLLDVVDPEVSTLSTLTNIQNSLFVPDLGSWVNRRPTYVLSDDRPMPDHEQDAGQSPERAGEPVPGTEEVEPREVSALPGVPADLAQENLQRTATQFTISSRLSDSRFAVLPHGAQLTEWTPAQKVELDDYVRHMLHSRRSRFKRSLQGFGKYVRQPLGFLVTLYATLITLFGLAWVLFLIGWIYVGEKQLYVIHVIDSVLVALFAIMGDGLAPFRAVDTYRMIFIAYYSHKTWRLRRERNLPKLKNKNDLPTRRFWISSPLHVSDPTSNPPSCDLEAAKKSMPELSVLSAAEQRRLEHHQKKFSRSHTFYQPHETETHFAFPIRHLIAIVCLLDAHSCLQISLGVCTWGIDYRVRPFALTTVILCLSITCNVTAGVLISLGDRKTRKKDVSKLLKRRELTETAIKHLEAMRRKDVDKSARTKDLNDKKSHKGSETKEGLKKGEKALDESGEEGDASMIPGTKSIIYGNKEPGGGPATGRNRLQKGNTWSNRRKARQM